MRKLRYGLLGTGNISVQHLEAAKQLQDCMKIVALCDVDEQSMEKKGNQYSIERRYRYLEDLLNDQDIDVVTVLTPPHIREQVVIPCLQSGKHVFVEKPFSLTLEEAKRMVESSITHQRWLGVNQNYRWRPEVRQIRSIIDEGLIGDVHMINMNQSFWRDETDGWRNSTEYLAISVMGVHWLDRFRWLTGDEPKSLYASVATSGLLASRGEDITSIVVTFKKGTLATLTHSWISRAKHGQADNTEIIGSEGTIVQRGPIVRLYMNDVDEVKEWFTYAPSQQNIFVDSFADSLRQFTHDVQNNRESVISGADNLKTMSLVDGAYTSSRTGFPVMFDF